jgi:hypothetical protein
MQTYLGSVRFSKHVNIFQTTGSRDPALHRELSRGFPPLRQVRRPIGPERDPQHDRLGG